jgi:hypothetical protein
MAAAAYPAMGTARPLPAGGTNPIDWLVLKQVEDIQMKNATAVAGLLAAILLAPASSQACSALGPNKHVGTVIGLDASAQTITVLDAQTRQPVTFLANEELLSQARNAKGQIIVDYEAEGTQLRAISIE